MTRRPRRLAARLPLVIALVATGVVGGIAAAPPSVALPGTVVEPVAIASERLLAGRPGEGLRLRGNRILARRDTSSAPTVVCAPIWFTAVGVTWDQQAGTPLELEIATGARRGDFGASRTLDAESGADPATEEYVRGDAASSLLWTGGSRCVRVTMRLPEGTSISALELQFINSSGSAAGPGTAPPNVDPSVIPIADPGAFAPAAASALAAQPKLISRQQWGARPGLMNCTPDVADEVRAGFVHHTAGTNRYTRKQADDIVRSIYAYHTRGRGWCDIAYNFLIDRFGRAYEGRSGGITEPVVGAAQQGFNTRAFSVSLMGTFTRKRPSSSMMRSLRKLLAWRLDVAHLNPRGRGVLTSAGGDNTRYDAGDHVSVPVITAHRTTGYTDCPGRKVVRRLKDVRRTVSRMGLPKIYKPRVEPSVVKAGSPPLRIRAVGSRSLEWSVSVHEAGGAQLFAFPPRTGSELDLVWEGSDATPYPRSSGTYELVVRGENADGEIARAATLPFKIKPSAL
ncbi:MAG: peptidoglycan recognition protein [Actinomycetota bacterium]